MKIAIVGTGIAGLTAGWLFKKAGHDVVFFEKLPSLGMAAHSLEFESDTAHSWLDVPPRMFNQSQWPNLVRLYDCLGVEYESVEPTKSFSRLGAKTYLNLDGSLQPKLGSTLLTKPVRRIVADAKKLMNQVTLSTAIDDTLTLRDFLDANDYSDEFIFDFLYPSLSSTICTCSYSSLDGYPASLIVQTLLDIFGSDLSHSRSLLRTRFGTRDVAHRLSADCDEILFESTVLSASVDVHGVKVVWQRAGRQSETVFDHLIVATQANQSVRFLKNLPDNERDVLESFEYEEIETLVHTDDSLMPRNVSKWSVFNFVSQGRKSMCTVWANRFAPDSGLKKTIFQTINPIVSISAKHLLAKISLQRPIVTCDSAKAWQALSELHHQPGRRIWFCGSYASDGVPLLESGVVSSLNAAKALGINVPETFSPSFV